jgi:hypothetical protein
LAQGVVQVELLPQMHEEDLAAILSVDLEQPIIDELSHCGSGIGLEAVGSTFSLDLLYQYSDLFFLEFLQTDDVDDGVLLERNGLRGRKQRSMQK